MQQLSAAIKKITEEQALALGNWKWSHNSNKHVWKSARDLYHKIGLEVGPAWGRNFYDYVITLDESPTLKNFNEYLSQFGWKSARIDGFITHSQYFQYLSEQTLPVNLALRTAEQLQHSPTPDLIHEVFGHMMQLESREFRTLMKTFGTIGVKLGETDKLDRLAWWFFEASLFDDGKKLIPTGAVIMSSVTEISRIKNPELVRPLTNEVFEIPFDEMILQPRFYSYSSFDTVWKLLYESAK